MLGAAGGPLPITTSRMGCLLDVLEHAFRVLGLERAAGGDEVSGELVLARSSSLSATWTVSRATVICGSSRRSLGEPRLRETVTLVGLTYSVEAS